MSSTENRDQELNQAEQPLDEGRPPRKPGDGPAASLKEYFSNLFISRDQDWPVWLVSGITFLNGAWAILSILFTRIPSRFQSFLPFSYYHWTRLLTVVVGFVLIYLSFYLFQRRRIAWYAALFFSAVAIAAHIVHTRAFIALPELIAFIILLLFRSRFNVKSEPRDIRLGAIIFAVSLAIALLYGTLGFWRLDQSNFGITFSLPDAIMRTLRQFVLLGNSDLVAHSRQAHWFLQSLNVLGIVTFTFALYSLFRPIIYRLTELPQERADASAIVKKNGSSTLDYFKVWQDKSYYFSSSRQAFISYRVAGGVAFCLADPVGPDEKEKEAVLLAFLKFCTENGWVAAFLIPDSTSLYNKTGLSLLKIGEEAIINLQRFASATSENKYFRYVRRKIEGDGYVYTRYQAPLSPALLNEVQEVSDLWMTLPHHREYGFMQGRFDKAYLKTCTLDALRDKEGKMVAFINEVPSFKPGEATFDLMRHLPGLHWGAMDYIFLRTMLEMKKAGFETFNFGVAPFAGIGKRENATITEKAVNQLFERLDRFVHAKGLRQYKLKFDPEWKDSYVAYQGGPLGLVRIALNISRIL